MGDFVKRTEIDRKLFERGVKDQLRDLVKITDAPRLAKAIIQVIEMQVASEELARLNEVEINSETVGKYMVKNTEFFYEQVDRAITKFIGSIYSQEG